ncbi:MAG: hypothetical protein HZB53_12480 [Chloroflexi bacterium]|nr:hypothetical protein [Chloroflexota bacterium]
MKTSQIRLDTSCGAGDVASRRFPVAVAVGLSFLGLLFFSLSTSVHAITPVDPFTTPVFDTALTHDGGQPCGVVYGSSPMLVDLDGNGTQEIVVGTQTNSGAEGDYSACLVVLNSDGTLRWSRVAPGTVNSTPAIDDLNGDGFKEIVVGVGAGSNPTTPGGIVAYDRNGNQLWFYRTLDRNGDGVTDGVWASPAIVDLNHDGRKQVVAGGWDLRLHLIDGVTGQAFGAPSNNLWPAEMLDTIWSSPAIADIDGDGKLDFIFGGDISANGAAGTQDGGLLRVMHNEQGIGPAHTTGFNVQYGNLTGAPLNIGHYGLYVNQSLYSSPVVADYGARGKMIIIGSGCAFPVGTNCNGTGNGKWVKVWSASGQLVATLATDAEVFSSPIVADVNGDSVLDIIATTMGNATNGGASVYVWSGQPGFPLLWSMKPKNFGGTQGILIPSSPIASDLNGDGQVEIIVGYAGEITVLDRNGRQLTETTGAIRAGIPTLWLGRAAISNSAAVGDLQGNGSLQIVAAGSFCLATCDGVGRVRAWNATLFAAGANPLVQSVRGVRSANWPQSGMAWPMFRHDVTHQGYEAAAPVVPPPNLPNKLYLPIIRK